MAGPAQTCERATSWGVSFLIALFGKYSKNPVIRSIAPDIFPESENTDKKRKIGNVSQLQDTSISSLHVNNTKSTFVQADESTTSQANEAV